MLERRWIRLGEEAMAHEAPLVAHLDELAAGEEKVRLRVPAGYDVTELAALFEAMRTDAPDDPLWKGVREVSTDGDAVVVEFRPGVDPGLLRTNDVDVACHLHDPQLRSEG
jgi:peptide/nickel transport system ATP-binding protein